MKAIFSDDYKKILILIKEARIEKGWSQKDLANKLGRTQSSISKIESGQVRLDIIQLKKISEVLGLEIGKIV